MKTKEWQDYLKRNFTKLSRVWVRRLPGQIIFISKIKDKWKLFRFPLTYGK